MGGNLSREKVSHEQVKTIDGANLGMESSKVTDSLTVFDDTGSKNAHPKEGAQTSSVQGLSMPVKMICV